MYRQLIQFNSPNKRAPNPDKANLKCKDKGSRIGALFLSNKCGTHVWRRFNRHKYLMKIVYTILHVLTRGVVQSGQNGEVL